MNGTRKSLLGAVAAALVLTACAGRVSTTAKDASSIDNGSNQGTVTFRSWSPIAQTTSAMVQATQAKFKDLQIQTEIFNYPEYLVDLSTRASSNTMADIVGLQPGALTQQYRTKLMPLNKCATTIWGDQWQDQFFKVGLAQARLGNPEGDNNYYMLPLLVQTVNLWQNTELMKNKQIEVPKTWDQLVNASKAFKDSGKAGLLLPAKDSWVRNVVFLQIANNIAPGLVYKAESGEAKWTDPNIVKAFDYWKQLFDGEIVQQGALALDAYPNGANQFEAGDAAMIPLGAWWIQQSDPAKKDAPPLSRGLSGFSPFLFPTIPGGANEPQLIGGIDVGLGIAADTKNPDAACRVLTDWIAGTGAQELINTFNDLPAVKGLNPAEYSSEHQEEVWKMMTEDWMPNVKYSRYFRTPAMDTAVADVLAGLAAGQYSSGEAATVVQKKQDEVLATQ